MERSQIQFDAEQASALKRRAAERGISVAALVREAVTQYLASGSTDERVARARRASGAFNSGLADVSENHDAYLAEDLLD
jgi:plasmid stability protein